MSFLALSTSMALALLASVALLIVFLYLLKSQLRHVTVSSNFIWRKLEAMRRPATDRWRWWLSLLLALVAGLNIALALTQPQVPAMGGVAERIVLVLDDSASMAARANDGKSRWDHAIERARGVILSASLASEFMVLDTLGHADTPDWVTRTQALTKLAKLSVNISGIAHMPIFPTGEQIVAILFTDGVADLEPGKNVLVESLFAPADNVAITAFDTKAILNEPTRSQALVQVFNASPRPRRIQLALTGKNGYALERTLDLAAGQFSNQTMDVSGFAAGVLRAEVYAPGDGFDIDNVAYSVVTPHRIKRVLLVTSGNRPLQDSLQLLPGVALTVLPPASYGPALKFDAFVFDRFAPVMAPSSGALLFGPSRVPWLPPFDRIATNPTITRWTESHPLGVSVSWRDLKVQRATLAKLSEHGPQTDLVLAKGAGEGVLVAAGGAGQRWIAVGFQLDQSNFAVQSGFPVFLAGALEWLTGNIQVLSRGLGRIEVAYVDAKVMGADGRAMVTANTAGATAFSAARPEVFTIASGSANVQLVANVTDPHFSDINHSRFTDRPNIGASRLTARRYGFEPWVVLIGLAVALLAFEWVTFTRRLTV